MPDPVRPAQRPPFECIALLLQGGGAIGAYQAGIYEALWERGLYPDWLAGVSIGAINAALIAGVPPKSGVDNLRTFWESVTPPQYWERYGNGLKVQNIPVKTRRYLNNLSAMTALIHGIPNFYEPRFLSPWLNPWGTIGETSFYDFGKLKSTLERLVDFDRINYGKPRFSVGAVNVRMGAFTQFDTTTHKIGPEHILASSALPPAFPAVEIDGEYYWDGGFVSNTPLEWVIESPYYMDTLIFQVDLWSAKGRVPQNMAEVISRRKELQYSSRTQAGTTRLATIQRFRHAFADILNTLPDELTHTPASELISSYAGRKVYNIVHLIYHAQEYEGDSKDYDFSRLSMIDRWQAGYEDMMLSLRHPQILKRPNDSEGIRIFDFSEERLRKKER